MHGKEQQQKAAVHVGFVNFFAQLSWTETFRIFKPSYRTDSYGKNSVTIGFFFILNIMSLAYLLKFISTISDIFYFCMALTDTYS